MGSSHAGPLASWREGPARSAILGFLAEAQTPGAPGFVAPDRRVAVFDSAGDREMLEYAQDGDGPSLCLVLGHDDPGREYAYAGASFTDPSAESILTTAARRGWSVVSMADDWTRVF